MVERDLNTFDQLQDISQLNGLRDRINGLTLCLTPEYFKIKDARMTVEAAESKAQLKQLVNAHKTFLKVRSLADKIFGYADRFHELLCERVEGLVADLEEEGPTREQVDQIDELLEIIPKNRDVYCDILGLMSDKIGNKWEEDPFNSFFKPLYDEIHERSMSYSSAVSADHSRLTDQLCEAVDRIVSA